MSTTWTVSLGRFSTGLTLEAQFRDEDGVVLDTTACTPLGNGRYIVTADPPSGAKIISIRETGRDQIVQAGALAVLRGITYPWHTPGFNAGLNSRL